MTQWNPSSPDEQKVWDILAPIDQKHLFDNIDKFSAEEKERFIQQVLNLNIYVIYTYLLLGHQSRQELSWRTS
jgi:UDP-N-acetylglucosamine pyrophosphorylase